MYHFLVDERRSVLLHAKGLLSHFGILGVRAGTGKIDPEDSLQLCNSVTKHVPPVFFFFWFRLFVSRVHSTGAAEVLQRDSPGCQVRFPPKGPVQRR